MKVYSPTPARPRAQPRSIPLFRAVPSRARHDGWDPRRQAEFIGYLAETRSVSAAAQRVGMARESAYRLRSRPGADSFNAAWRAALGQRAELPKPPSPAKVTALELRQRVDGGWWRVHLARGKFAGLSQEPDNSALLRLLAQLGRQRKLPPRAAPEPVVQAGKVT